MDEPMTAREQDLQQQLNDAIQMRDYWAVRVVDLEAEKFDLKIEVDVLRGQVRWLRRVGGRRGRVVQVTAEPHLYSVRVEPDGAVQ